MSDKTIIFYSGKLWHSDKPFPVKPGEQNYNPELRDHQYPDDLVIYWDKVKLWLSTAYEVVNPEVIPGIRKARKLVKLNPCYGFENLNDGDQITLPEGYGIEKHYQPDSGPLVRRVAITLPEPEECPKCRIAQIYGDSQYNQALTDVDIIIAPLFEGQYPELHEIIVNKLEELKKLKR